jgi:hypothetical protein
VRVWVASRHGNRTSGLEVSPADFFLVPNPALNPGAREDGAAVRVRVSAARGGDLMVHGLRCHESLGVQRPEE